MEMEIISYDEQQMNHKIITKEKHKELLMDVSVLILNIYLH